MVNVSISGFTAAGKTTHGRILAHQLQLPLISSTHLLADLVAARCGGPRVTRWHPTHDEARVSDPSIDSDLDAALTAALESSAGGIFDACLLPWIAPHVPALNVWIDSGIASRVRKCIVSHLDEDVDSFEAKRRVMYKDKVTVDRLSGTTGKCYWPDPAVFHLIISNGDLIPEATAKCSRKGIETFSELLLGAVRYCLGDADEPPPSLAVILARRPEDSLGH